MAKLDASERRRLEVEATLAAASPGVQPPSWRAVQRRACESLADWRSLLLADVAIARDAFRKLLNGLIRFTPFEVQDGRGLRFEGRIGLAALLGDVVTKEVTRVGIEPTTIRLKVECSTTELPGRLNRAPLGACYLGAT